MNYAQFIAALTLWREASSSSSDARTGIFNVINNRVAKPGWWGKDIVSVCLKPFQFSSMTALNDPNLRRWPVGNEPEWNDSCAIVQRTSQPDTTFGATYYWTAPLTSAPTEFGNVEETMLIDGVHFCKPI